MTGNNDYHYPSEMLKGDENERRNNEVQESKAESGKTERILHASWSSDSKYPERMLKAFSIQRET